MSGVVMSLAQNYSYIDKLLHHLAFSIPASQKILCDLENNIYKGELKDIETNNEVFVTGLPRSGTTLLLELLYKTNEFDTFSYRQMPFILSPLIWGKISQQFSKKAEKVQRAHGDGMEVSFDSPEAFEEVIWLSYLKDRYVKTDRLEPLIPSNTTKEFAKNIKLTIRKLLLSSSSNGEIKRYISKNNANCSRLNLLTKLFPTATILVPFREPLAHIGSLMKQHQQFNKMHSEDKFSKNYMQWLGHYDFGENFKPIDFNQWLESYEGQPDYNDENFWMQYWCSAYENILDNAENNVHLVDFDKLLSAPEESLSAISKHTKLKDISKLVSFSSEIRSPTSRAKKSSTIKKDILDRANDLYRKLQSSAI